MQSWFIWSSADQRGAWSVGEELVVTKSQNKTKENKKALLKTAEKDSLKSLFAFVWVHVWLSHVDP